MLAFGANQELERVAAGLAGAGACATLLIEAESLDWIERRYGGEAYRSVMERLIALVREFAEEAFPGLELLVSEERSRSAIVAFVFCPRSQHAFYAEATEGLAQEAAHKLAAHGRRAVYPYSKGRLDLPVGVSVLLHNPTIKPERQILHAVDEARHDAELEARLRERRDLRQLMQVILGAQVQVRYEAIVDLENTKVLGYEALSRGPEGSDLRNPRDLFGRAEHLGLLFELDCLCRRVALENSGRLPEGSMIFLNCLPTAIGDPNLRDDGLRKLLEEFELAPRDLVLEISESESIDNFGAFREMAHSCRELGIRLAIDDAGTGYSSLEAIMEIAPDFIKTDMILVRGIDQDQSRKEVVRAMNAVAAGIGAQVVAEGIETEAELRALRELGVRYGQGFYFGAALRGEPRRD